MHAYARRVEYTLYSICFSLARVNFPPSHTSGVSKSTLSALQPTNFDEYTIRETEERSLACGAPSPKWGAGEADTSRPRGAPQNASSFLPIDTVRHDMHDRP
jgi:hypothetical protein